MVKTHFGIKDLENLSNVKAHTIRIWEKRYNLLEPDRTDTNIRKYDLDNLKKLLNITYLYNAGHKISKLASLDSTQIQQLIRENITDLDSEYMLNVFKSAMFEFDGKLFDNTLEKMLEKKSLREVFSEVFVPLLNEMGILWHSGTLDPSHEHFISEKIKHSIIQQTNFLEKSNKKNISKNYVLYLPFEEVHEIGLLFANYELLASGFNTIYLGPNIPQESLTNILQTKSEVVFITFFTVRPEHDKLENYLIDFENNMCSKAPCELWILGRRAEKSTKHFKNIKFFNDLQMFTNQIEKLSED
ncbi:hypothetical protein Aeqsu_0294 [Aequorivita sublithincola DSM 14238]|uniref:HTH merR-type domain-containing protein n=1 Tax=Aequorivita sublithincola (strain DSM 14238 / LMG 21431 / ACAM 643 / 9-3) TaxID=746697 RepID=I3YS40_AEQSU|nr:MerR family transcriptional regulator [Aequorivita sublithincola]AFL79808.1 hypothetical protein Aeqsu_0294 [Aequorivita sublithincola DSM 14238]